MAIVSIGTLLQIRYKTDSGWTNEHLFQNCNIAGTVSYDSETYNFLNFVYTGATRTRTGDNIESALVFAANKISQGYAQKIIEGRPVSSNGETTLNAYQVVVRTCLMNPDFTAVNQVITTEYWTAASMGYDVETLEVLLTSGIDAFSANISNMMLTTKRVGALPTTAQIRAL